MTHAENITLRKVADDASIGIKSEKRRHDLVEKELNDFTNSIQLITSERSHDDLPPLKG
jgi:hypothetical protein